MELRRLIGRCPTMLPEPRALQECGRWWLGAMTSGASHLIMGTWGRAWRLDEVQVVLGHASRTTTERYARLAPDSIRRVANEAVEQLSDDCKVAPGLVDAKFAIHPSARNYRATD